MMEQPNKSISLSDNLSSRRLTIRQLKFIESYVNNGGNVSKAALQAGYAHRQRGWELVSKSVIWQYIELEFNEGFSEEMLASALKRGLEATKIIKIPARCILRDSITGKDVIVAHRKMAIEVPDNMARLKALEIICKLYGYL